MDHPEAIPAVPARIVRNVVAVICSLMLLAIMAVTAIDVIGRYVFDAPLKGGTEMTELLLVSIIFVGLPAVCLDNSHVRVDLLTDWMPPATQPLRLLVTGLVTGGALAIIGSRLWIYAGQFAGYGGKTTSLGIPIAPVAYMCAAATFAGAAITLVSSIAIFVRGRAGNA